MPSEPKIKVVPRPSGESSTAIPKPKPKPPSSLKTPRAKR